MHRKPKQGGKIKGRTETRLAHAKSRGKHRQAKRDSQEANQEQAGAREVPRQAKPSQARRDQIPVKIPIDIRGGGVPVSERLNAYIRAQAGRKLGKFRKHVNRVTVRFEDVNGPRGGVDIESRIKIVLIGVPSVLVRERRATARPAFDVAVGAAETALRRTLERSGRSTTPKSRGVTAG